MLPAIQEDAEGAVLLRAKTFDMDEDDDDEFDDDDDEFADGLDDDDDDDEARKRALNCCLYPL